MHYLEKLNYLYWVPDALSDKFTREVNKAYFEMALDELPSIWELTYWISDELLFEVASYYETLGQDTDHYAKEIIHQYETERTTNIFRSLQKEYFDQACDDVLRMMRHQGFSYCFLDNRNVMRDQLVHYGKEVW